IILKVPAGTVVKDAETGKVILDMSNKTEPVTLLKGGRGGKGNRQYVTSVMQAPKYAQPGKPAKELWVTLELKMIADVGLVGFPNVGKSTFLSRVTNAKPKIANYHFTTIDPNLGIVQLSNTSFCMADIAGIIEGASKGLGLGFKFLKHIERTKVLIHVVDVSGCEGRDPIEDFDKINEELRSYDERLMKKPQIVAANKIDIISEDDPGYIKFRDYVEGKGYKVFPVSAPINMGVKALLEEAARLLAEVELNGEAEPIEYEMFDFETENKDPEYRKIKGYYDEKDGVYVLEGKQLEKIFNSTNFEDFGSLRYLYRYIEKQGGMDILIGLGLEEGDTVRIKDFEFEYYED
ncbi:MAG: Obg family GTPase CgtA, partial [Anaerovoracaceae bacterium]|nr:Obg family GTPase CgtA [Anaerovoracaceae bacterium]